MRSIVRSSFVGKRPARRVSGRAAEGLKVSGMISGAQIREARKLLGWSRDRLAPRGGLPVNRLGDYELGRRILPLEEVEALKGALEAAGVEFTNGDEPGVRLKAATSRP